MIKYRLLFLFFLTSFVTVHAQEQIRTVVYFDFNNCLVRPDEKLNLNAFVDSLNGLQLEKIEVIGHTDYTGDDGFNNYLAQKRSEKVVEYLQVKNPDWNKLIQIRSEGEKNPVGDNNSVQGRQSNRRVEIIAYFRKKEVIVEEKEEDKVILDYTLNLCDRDTIIYLKGGIEVVFNTCEYLKKKDCIELESYTTPEEAITNNLTTLTFDNNPLASCGMVNLSFLIKPECNKDDCFEHPVVIRFPVRGVNSCIPCSGGNPPDLYDIDENGKWTKSKEELKKVMINDKAYFEYKVKCPSGRKNCDCKIPSSKFKIKSRRKYRIASTTLSSDCPFGVYSLPARKQYRRNVIRREKVPCFIGNGDIEALLIDKHKDTLVMTKRQLETLKNNIILARCKDKSSEVDKKILGIFPHKKRLLYRKYKIRDKDLVPIEEARREVKKDASTGSATEGK